MGKNALLLPPPRGRTGEGPSGAGGGRFGRPGPRRRPGVEGKGGGGPAGSIPGLTLGRGGAQRRGDAGWRRRRYRSGAAALALGGEAVVARGV